MCMRGMPIVTHIANLNLAAQLVFESFSDPFLIGVLSPSIYFPSDWNIVFAYFCVFRSTFCMRICSSYTFSDVFDPNGHIQSDVISVST